MDALKSMLTPMTGGGGLQDTLKLVLIGGTVESARKASLSAWNGFVDSFILTATFTSDDYPYDWIMHWLAKQPAWGRSRELEATIRSASQPRIDQLTSEDKTHTMIYRGHWLRITHIKRDEHCSDLKISVVARSNDILKKLVLEAKKDYEKDFELPVDAAKSTATPLQKKCESKQPPSESNFHHENGFGFTSDFLPPSITRSHSQRFRAGGSSLVRMSSNRSSNSNSVQRMLRKDYSDALEWLDDYDSTTAVDDLSTVHNRSETPLLKEDTWNETSVGQSSQPLGDWTDDLDTNLWVSSNEPQSALREEYPRSSLKHLQVDVNSKADFYTIEESDGTVLVIKQCSKFRASQEDVEAEASVWRMLGTHPNILPFRGISVDSEQAYPGLLSPFMPNGTLREYLQTHLDADRLYLLRSIAIGFEHMHSLDIVHLDVKPVNIFVDANGNPVIGDFGSALHLPSRATSSGRRTFTVRYAAPECLLNDENEISTKSDVYSYAWVVVEVFTGEVPYCEVRKDVVVEYQLLKGVLHPKRMLERKEELLDAGLPTEFFDILMSCWETAPADRPNMVDICMFLAGKFEV